MANRRGKKKNEEQEALSKDDETYAKHVRFNCPTETTLFQGNEVHYFTGSKAVDTLYESKYGQQAKGDARFGSRAAVTDFMQTLLEQQLIWRARKLVPKKKDDAKKKGEENTKSPKADDPKTKKNKKKEAEEEEKVDETEDEKKVEEKKEDDGKKKKKVKLEVHSTQYFNDASDVYVWVYDPTPFYKKVIGLLMVIGTIIGCLFPLWPMWLRQGIYYLSVAGISFFGIIIAVAILRTILFGLIWLVTMGEHKLWILPNLTEDVGFFESFAPLYTYERASQQAQPVDNKKDKKSKKAKDSDAEEEPKEDTNTKESKKSGNEEDKDTSQGSQTGSESEEASASGDEQEVPDSPESQTRQRRRPRKADGDYVMVSK